MAQPAPDTTAATAADDATIYAEARDRWATIAVLQSRYIVGPHSMDMLALTLATMASITITNPEEPPVWLLLNGGPSSGKSDTIRRAHTTSVTVFRDEITAHALCSGHVDQRGRAAGCLLDKLDRKTLACPDLAALFGKDERAVKALLATMTNAYDGRYAKASGTQQASHEHKAQFAFIGAVTPAGAARFETYLSEIGPRIVMYRVPELTIDQRSIATRALRDKQARAAIRDQLTTRVREHLATLARVTTPPALDEGSYTHLEAYAELLACGRGVVTDGACQIENTTRAVQVLTTLAQAVALVRGHVAVAVDDLRLVGDVVLGSMPEDRAQLVQRLACSPEPLTIVDLAGLDTEAARARVRRTVEVLERLRLAERVGRAGQGGADLVAPTKTVRAAFEWAWGQSTSEKATTPGTCSPLGVV
jgi:hypothetical protein